MAAGEHMATKSPAELFEGEITLERQHIRAFGEEGLRELGEPLGLVGLEGELREKAVEHFARDDASLLHVMTALEFGVVETERRKPHVAMWLSGAMVANLESARAISRRSRRLLPARNRPGASARR